MNQGIGQRSTYMKPDNEIPTPLIFAFSADLEWNGQGNQSEEHRSSLSA